MADKITVRAPQVPRTVRRDLVINNVACHCCADMRLGRWHAIWCVGHHVGTPEESFASSGRALGAAERAMREYLARTSSESTTT